ncbi:MAG: helix-turn-helix transcriptional regulator [Bacteriovoracaceae bacterium]|nr:helix-turn-helix transcriptional regulator [Bacteriovoracaceae bacterium]
MAENFAKMFRAIRKNAGLSQDELADTLDSTQSTISKIEAGTIPIPGTILWLTFAARFHFSPFIYQQSYIDSKKLLKVKPYSKFKRSSYYTNSGKRCGPRIGQIVIV